MGEVPDYIEKLTRPQELKNLMANARAGAREDIYWAAFRRLCNIEGMNAHDALHRDFYGVLAAYEILLTEKNGRTTKASRTRQKLARHGIERCLEDWALSSKPTQGFNMLISSGMQELTAEYLIIKYSERFSPQAVAAAEKRLTEIAA